MGAKLLVAVDDSTYSTKAFEFAIDQFEDAEITVLHVIDTADIYRASGIEDGMVADYAALRESQELRAQELVESLASQAAEAGTELDTDYTIGDVAKSIVTYASENECDHIIVGSRGRTGASRILLGSVAETVVRRAEMPVTVVR